MLHCSDCGGRLTTHADLVDRQRRARRKKADARSGDSMWQGDIARETESLMEE